MKHLTTTDFSSTVSPYRLPVINNYVTPVPPLTKKKERGPRANGTLRGRKLRPTTAPTAATEVSMFKLLTVFRDLKVDKPFKIKIFTYIYSAIPL